MNMKELLEEIIYWLEQPDSTIDDIRQFTNEIYDNYNSLKNEENS